jgi:uncharacterized protein (DUF2147 family)
MKKFGRMIVLGLSGLLAQSLYASDMNSPVGYWKTIDDVTGQTKSIIQIQEAAENTLSGTVVKLFQDATKSCTKCTGLKKNQPIMGMVILDGLNKSVNNAGQWTNGQILDPKNGKTYHCNVQVINQGQALQVRGYIGVPLFGRSQTWIRVPDTQISQT